MSNFGRYYEVLGLVNFTPNRITGKDEIYDSYFVDSENGRKQLKENQIDKCWDKRIPYREEGKVISHISDCGYCEGMGFLKRIGTFYDDDFPEDADFLKVSEEERKEVVEKFKESLGIDIDPAHITKSRYVYWG